MVGCTRVGLAVIPVVLPTDYGRLPLGGGVDPVRHLGRQYARIDFRGPGADFVGVGLKRRGKNPEIVHDHGGEGAPRIAHQPVTITRSRPAARHYGGEGEQAVLT